MIARNTVDAFDLDALMPPDIDGDLEGIQSEAGAEFDDVTGVPLHYGDAEREAEAIRSRVGILDRSGRWAMLRVSGPGAVDALNAAGADPEDMAALMALAPGQGAVLRFGDEEEKEKTLGMAHVQGGGLLLILPTSVADAVTAAAAAAQAEGGPEGEIMDLAEQCVLLSLVGPGAGEFLALTGISGGAPLAWRATRHRSTLFFSLFFGVNSPTLKAVPSEPHTQKIAHVDRHGVDNHHEALRLGVMQEAPGTHSVFGFEGRPVVAAHGVELGGGLVAANLVVDEGIAGQVWVAMTAKGAEPVGTQALDTVVAAV